MAQRELSGLLAVGLCGGLLLVVALGGCPGQAVDPGGEPAPVVAGGNQNTTWDGTAGGNAQVDGDDPDGAVDPGAPADEVAELLNQQVTALAGKTVSITLGAEVAGGGTVQFEIVAHPQHGELGSVVPTGPTTATVSYAPEAGFAGDDRFTYRVAAGGAVSAPAVVEIEVLEAIYFTLDVYAGPPPLTVRGTAHVPAGEALPAGEYTWSFGGSEVVADGDEDAVAQATFTRAGLYTVTLAVTLAGAAGPVGCLHDGGGAAPNVAGATVRVSPAVSGTVRSGGQPLAGVTVRASDVAESATTNNQGMYKLYVPYDWSGQITPQASGHEFTPASVVLSHVTADRTAVDFNEDVRDGNEPPVANAGPDRVLLDEDLNGREALVLDGSGSHDPDGQIVRYRWSYESATRGSGVLAEGPEPTVQVELETGDYEITLGVEDNDETWATDACEVQVHRPGILAVVPADGLESSGRQGSGSFAPASKPYTLTNTGEWVLEWSAAKAASWLNLSAESGELQPAGQATLVVSINVTAANGLAPGVYSDTVVIRNETRETEFTRDVELTVLPAAAALRVTPANDLASNGLQGGPFAPASETYTLENTGGEALNWTASKTVNWLSVTPSSGILAAGETVDVLVAYNANANTLNPGVYEDTVSLVNTSNHAGDTSRAVELTVNAPEGCLGVTPAGDFVSSGPIGGPFDPASQVYTLKNVGGQPIAWTASKAVNWLDVTPASGNLNANQSVQVTVALNGNANGLAVNPNPYTDTVALVNTTNHCGDASRGVALTVTELPAMVVTPHEDFESVGPEGGPFDPASKVYTLENTGGQPLDWVATKNVNWLTITPAAGTVPAGGQVEVTVALNASANALPFQVEFYTDEVAFENTTNGDGDTTRAASLRVLQLGDSIEQYGITWTFDKEYPVGQFVNGDWWVLDDGGGVIVTDITPTPTGSGASRRHGSMINPVNSATQSYDGRAPSYVDDYTVGPPLALSAGESLVSCESRPENDGPRADWDGSMVGLSEVTLISAAVLTCLSSPPSLTAFRPPYAGMEKPIYDASNINWTRLENLSEGGTMPNSRVNDALRFLERPWLDHSWAGADAGQETRPLLNCDYYYRNTHIVESRVAVMLLVDEGTPAFAGQKRELVRRYIQRGIDQHYMLATVGSYSRRADRCLSKLPGMVAGLLLGDEGMRTADHGYTYFKTDRCTYFGQSWTEPGVRDVAAAALFRIDAPGEQDPETQNYEHLNPLATPSEWCGLGPDGHVWWRHELYRRGTHSYTWVGSALAARYLGLMQAWNHQPFFDYVDRWMEEDESGWLDDINAKGGSNPCGSWTYEYQQGYLPKPGSEDNFVKYMWMNYRH